MKPYDQVRIVRLHRTPSTWVGDETPSVGDRATVLEIYETPRRGYDLECVTEAGHTRWGATFYAEDAEFEVLEPDC